MNINAKQMLSIDTTRLDNTTVLGFFGQIKGILEPQTQLTTTMGSVWTAYVNAYANFDQAYAQQHRWMQTEDINALDKERDAALSAFLNALKAMQETPNADKRQAAKYLMNIRGKYTLDPGDEYMKETTAISQMIQEMEADAKAAAALTTTGLDDWVADLKAKNNAFLQKMNERTEAQAGLQKGIVRDTRLAAEAAYRDLVKLINAMSICQVGDGIDYDTIIDRLNAEIEHYRQILARKGGGGSGDNPTPTPTPTPTPEPTPEPTPDPEPEPTPDPTPDPTPTPEPTPEPDAD